MLSSKNLYSEENMEPMCLTIGKEGSSSPLICFTQIQIKGVMHADQDMGIT